jgi:hypothetical protein
MVILKRLDRLASEVFIPAKAGIQSLFLGPRFRAGDNQGNLASAYQSQSWVARDLELRDQQRIQELSQTKPDLAG